MTRIPAFSRAPSRWFTPGVLLILVCVFALGLCDASSAKTLSELGSDTKTQVGNGAKGFYYAGVMVGAIVIMIVAWRRWVVILVFALMAAFVGTLVVHPEKLMNSLGDIFMGIFT